MIESKLKSLLKTIELWDEFCNWIYGQTVSYSDNEIYFYEHDIRNFLSTQGYTLVDDGSPDYDVRKI